MALKSGCAPVIDGRTLFWFFDPKNANLMCFAGAGAFMRLWFNEGMQHGAVS